MGGRALTELDLAAVRSARRGRHGCLPLPAVTVTAPKKFEGVLIPGRTCWRTETSQRVAILMDNEPYYAALYSALLAAERSIHILGWAFDPRTRLSPDGTDGPDDPDEVWADPDRALPR